MVAQHLLYITYQSSLVEDVPLLPQEQDNQQYLTMVQRVLATPGFYFSHSYDLTHSSQRKQHLMQTRPNFPQLPLHERADERFMWNAHILRDLVVQPELRRFIVPMIHGFVAIKGCTINGKPFVFTLISRRSAHRAGQYPVCMYVCLLSVCTSVQGYIYLVCQVFVTTCVVLMTRVMSPTTLRLNSLSRTKDTNLPLYR